MKLDVAVDHRLVGWMGWLGSEVRRVCRQNEAVGDGGREAAAGKRRDAEVIKCSLK